jgi:hypothetical protein
MALNFRRTETFACTVNVEMPSDDEKKPLKGSFVAKFKHLNRQQMAALQEDLKDGRLTDELFLDGYLVGVSGIGDADGKPMAEADQRAIVYTEPAVTLATVRAFFSAITGAGAKN